MRVLRLYLSSVLLLLGACATVPSDLDRSPSHLVAVKSARLPEYMPWYTLFAEHSWIDIKDGEEWTRVEVIGRSSGVRVRRIRGESARSDVRWDKRRVLVHAWYAGAEAERLGRDILAIAKDYPFAESYSPFPGPNSNTFIEWLSQQVSGLRLVQPPAALGKDYPPNTWVRAGVTTSRLGLELETPYLGTQVGLQEGVEVHLLGLTIGVGIYPPSLKLPLLPAFPWEWF